MITERQYIKDNLYNFFIELLTAQGITDIPLIYDNENGPRPKSPFLMVEFRSTVNPGMPTYSKVSLADGTKVQHIIQHTRRNMTLYGFGERALDVLEIIKSQLNADIWVDKLRKLNMVIPQTMETLESPQSFETTQENGASFDFDLTYLRVIETNPGYIETVELNQSFTQ
ncbi:MAG: hypothetical protein LBO67_04800 [Spirochaetaceae bacterium]|jgi:hypothetical protein|nr:hypothetical protein [Spirochaetaceae bacterium]